MAAQGAWEADREGVRDKKVPPVGNQEFWRAIYIYNIIPTIIWNNSIFPSPKVLMRTELVHRQSPR